MIGMIKKKRFVLIYIIAVIISLSGCTGQFMQETDGAAAVAVNDDAAIKYRYEQKPQIRQPTPEEAEKYPKLTNLPALYIDVEIIPMEKISRSEYVPGMYTLVYGEDGGIYSEPLTIKGRGKYSWSFPKKPYTLELAKDTGWYGMNSARKWILISTHSDKTMLRNYITLKLAREVSDNFTPDCFYADVYFNNVYNGTYLIAESIQIHENRLNLDINTEAVFEIEATYRCEGHDYCIDMIGGNHHINYKRPGSTGKLSPDGKKANLEVFKNFFEEMQQALKQGYGEYSKYIDVDSFVNWYLVSEFCKNFDSAFTASCYAFMKDGKIHMGPFWDYDTCYGNQDVATCLSPEGYHIAESPWYKILTRDGDFRRLLYARWTQLRDDGVFDDFVKMIDDTVSYISQSAEKNYEIWRGALRETGLRGKRLSKLTFEDEITYLHEWVAARIEWLDSEWYAK